MLRPVRRARQKATQGEVVGMLHQEELALRRALYASLFGEKSPQKSDSGSPGNDGNDSTKQDIDHQQASSPSGSVPVSLRPPSPEPSPIDTPQKRMKMHSPSPSYECLSPDFGSGIGSSPAHGMYTSSNLSSPIGSPGSIESSLRLVLSTSSWSSSTSSNWSSEPSSPYAKARPKKIPKKRSPVKQKGNTPSQKSPGKGKKKSKLTVNDTLFGNSSPGTPKSASPKTKLTPEKGSKVTNKVKKPSSNGTPGKGKVRIPVGSKRNSRVPLKRKRGNKQTVSLPQEQDHNPLSPEAAVVLHDHCYSSSKGNISGMYMDEVRSEATGQAANSDKISTAQQLSSSALCSSYQAQRKFAHNHAPPQRLSSEESGNISSLKEIPKTEDFISFLCLRGSDSMPAKLEKFGTPWTPLKKSLVANGQMCRVRSLPGSNGKGLTMKSRPSVAKKLDFASRLW